MGFFASPNTNCCNDIPVGPSSLANFRKRVCLLKHSIRNVIRGYTLNGNIKTMDRRKNEKANSYCCTLLSSVLLDTVSKLIFHLQ